MRKKTTSTRQTVARIGKTRVIKLKHHHRKPYRKRHYASLTLFLILALALGLFVVVYKIQTSQSIRGARETISDIFGNQQPTGHTVKSSLGFTVEYNGLQYYAGAIDSSTGNLFIGEELLAVRPYDTVRISPLWLVNNDKKTSLAINFTNKYNSTALTGIEDTLVREGINSTTANLQKISSEGFLIDGRQFLKTQWRLVPLNPVITKLTVGYTTYVGVVNGAVFTIKINQGFNESANNLFEPVISSIKFDSQNLPSVQITPEASTQLTASRSFIDTMMFSAVASAASVKAAEIPSEKISSLYGPAVVKIYNFYCMDIYISGILYLKDECNALTGSGFFVSPNGYVATNGHVVRISAKDVVIYRAFENYVKGDQQYVNELVKLAGLTDEDFASVITEQQAASVIMDKFYQIPDDVITTKNDAVNLLVGLNDKTPDLATLATITKNRKILTETASIRQAKLVAYNYRMFDGIIKFEFSDVAILKIDNKDLPLVSLGSIEGLSQGSNLTILGFPGTASDNGLVDNKQSKASLTSGKVSSIKDSTGSTKKLIETDATIGHGNSGGPVFSDDGDVVGIATYTIDGSGPFHITGILRDPEQLILSMHGMNGLKLRTWSRTGNMDIPI